MLSPSETPDEPGWIRQAARWGAVVRYYRLSQLVMRVVGLGRRRLLRWTGGRRYRRLPDAVAQLRKNPGFGPLLQEKLSARRCSGSTARADAVLRGEFRFLSQPRLLQDPVDWRLASWPEAPHLWRFCLHYHEFLLDLAAEGLDCGQPAWLRRAWQLVHDWIAHNRLADPRTHGDAWHPYCISRRLPAWILLWSADPPSGDSARRVLQSMFRQARFLEDHLEWDVQGNHLLENVRALLLAGAFFEGADAQRWLRRGAGVLRAQLVEQILPHGEHFERSPMYHAQMLDTVLDIRDATAAVLPELTDLCASTTANMAAFLGEILHPDREIPLLGDSCFGQAAPAELLIRRAAQPSLTQAAAAAADPGVCEPAASTRTVGDFWVHRCGDDFLLFDAGAVGPDCLPAHAHADLLGFEASVLGRRLIVDVGVYNYQDDAMRRYCRSSAAHNVLQVDDRDQCDMWSRFRMGRRGWPSGFVSGKEHGFHWARAEHNAYRRLGVARVGRWIACRRHGPWFFVDWAAGSGRHKLTSRLHLHPDVEVDLIDAGEVCLRHAETEFSLRPLTPGDLTVETGWYCPQFGRRLRCPVVQWTTYAALPLACGWHLGWGDADGRAGLTPFNADGTLLTWNHRNHSHQWRPLASPQSVRVT